MTIMCLSIGFVTAGFWIAVKSSKIMDPVDRFEEIEMEAARRENEIYHM